VEGDLNTVFCGSGLTKWLLPACLHCQWQLLEARHFHHLRAFSVDLRQLPPRFTSLPKHQEYTTNVVLKACSRLSDSGEEEGYQVR
jgi:hypothetical protein